MSTPILNTKLYIPPARNNAVVRSQLIERLEDGAHGKLTLISAPAGFGKTTLLSEWLKDSERVTAWLSLDEGDSDVKRFFMYLIAALQTIDSNLGKSALGVLHASPSAPIEAILTNLLNEIATLEGHFLLVLDDYHLIDSAAIDNAMVFLLEHMPPQIHVVIATREDPQFPLARLRARNQLHELRVSDLRFSPSEAAIFLNGVMGLKLSDTDIATLEIRTEGWIVGLQLAAISMQGHEDKRHFIESFSGSHHYVLDYLLQEVLQQQDVHVQTFLLRTAILERLCAPLCDAVLRDESASGQETLAYLEQANLFIIPLDNERRWYRYHHLFADLLRQRLQLSADAPQTEQGEDLEELHKRASLWYEENGLELEAFHHAAAAHDVLRAERLIEGKGMPLHFRGAVTPVLNWLQSLPESVLNSMPILWTAYASTLLASGYTADVEHKLAAAELALEDFEPDSKTQDIIGRIAAIRATLAANYHRVDEIISQSERALDLLAPDNLAFRTSTLWKLGYAYHLQGKRIAASQAYQEVIATGEASGNMIFVITAMIGLAGLQRTDNQLHLAAETYQETLQWFEKQPLPIACEVHSGLGEIFYQWNDLDAAQEHGERSVQLARQVENTGRFIASELFLARVKLAQGDISGAAVIIAGVEHSMREPQFGYQMPEFAATQVLLLIRQDNLDKAAHIAQKHQLALSLARVHIAKAAYLSALQILDRLRQDAEEKGWADEQLKTMVLQSLALYEEGEKARALDIVRDALHLAAASGSIRIFLDEGLAMAKLLSEAVAQNIMPDYIEGLLDLFKSEQQIELEADTENTKEILSPRELEVLDLIAQGLSNSEIGKLLFLAVSSVKGHNRNIFDKLRVNRRTEAVARARELGLL